MSVWSAAASSVAVPPQEGLSAVTRAATASSTGSGGSVHARFRTLQRPYQPFLVLGKIESLVLLVTPGHVQNGTAICPLLLLKKKGPVRRSQQTVGAGDHIKLIIGLLLAGVMYNQEANPAYIGKPFQFGDYLIVVGIAVLLCPGLPDFLQGVDDNKPGVWVFPDKAL